MSSTNSEIKEFIAYEKILKYSPVFVYYCPINEKNYVYVSQNLDKLDKGQPYVIGVCINSPRKGKIAKVQIKGITKVRYFGSYPTINLSVYVATSYNNVPLIGVASSLEKGIIPKNYQSSFIHKVGTVYPLKCGKPDKDVKARLVNINLDIDNQSFDLYNIYTFDLLPKGDIYGRDFSYYQIGQDLNTGLKNPLVIEKFNLLLTAYEEQVSLKDLCFATDQYCQTLFDAIPDPYINKYEKSATVTTSNGQIIFISNNNLRIYNYKTNDVQLITLNPNSLGKSNFPLYKSLSNAPFWAYVNINDPNNNGFIGSGFYYPAGSAYEVVQAYINGVGIAARYSTTTSAYNYCVTYYLGLTDSYNVNDSEAFIIRLIWSPK
jgi:hypothetical protein